MAINTIPLIAKTDSLDYSVYEEKLSKITSVKLEEIVNLAETDRDIEHTCVAIGSEYLKRIEELLAQLEKELI